MRATRVTTYGESDVLQLVDVEPPEPGPGEVRIDIQAIGVNFAEIMQRRGDYFGGPEPPYVPGAEAAGPIDAVGEGVERTIGDRVAVLCGTGAYAEHVVVSTDNVIDVPDSMTFASAAAVPANFLTAHAVLFEWGRLTQGERVLIHAAAGGVGTAGVQLASNAGAEVYGTASTDEKLSLTESLGCSYPINYEAEDFADRVNQHTDGAGLDLVLDGVGGNVLDKSLDILAPFGRLVTYGVASGSGMELDPRRLFFENRSIVGFHLGHAFEHNPERVEPSMEELSELLKEGTLDVIVGKEFPLEGAAEAHKYIEDRRSSGKVILRP